MFPLLPQELGDDFSLEEILKFGSIPLAPGSLKTKGPP